MARIAPLLRSMVAGLVAAAALSACAPRPSAEAQPGAGEGGPAIVVSPPVSDRVVPSTQGAMMMSLAPVVDRASPAVVNVYAARRARGPSILDDPVMRRFGEGLQDLPEGRISQSLGSGVIVRADGVIVTNNHVVQGADELKVVLADRREFDARLILSDPRTDLAVLQIVGADAVMPTLPFADTSAVKVGDMVLAIGNPFGLTQTVTSGIVSALARTEVGVSDFSFFIQTDAAINRGNSGGALVDMTGALVGVNTAIYSETGGSNGVGFAIPAEMVRRVVEAAVTEGRVVRPWLGARVEGVTQARARELGLSRPQGVIITAVYPGAAADAAGLTAGDVILRVGPVAIADEQGLRFQFATYTPGMQVPLTVRRNGQEETVLAPAQAPPAGEADARQLSGRHPLNGAVIVTLSPATADERGLDPFLSGVVITQVDGLRRDIRRGDIIRTVNGRSVQSASEVERALSTARGPITLGIEREGRVVELAYPA